MDKGSNNNRWSWLPSMMPGVSKLMAEKRAQYGAEHVKQCWHRSVVLGEPGWLYAREGPISIGTPFEGDPALSEAALPNYTRTQAILIMRNPEHGHGAH